MKLQVTSGRSRPFGSTLAVLALVLASACSPRARPGAGSAADATSTADTPVLDVVLDVVPVGDVVTPPVADALTDSGSDIDGVDGDAAPDLPPADQKASTDGDALIVVDAAGSTTEVECPGCQWQKINELPLGRINFATAWSGKELYIWGGADSLASGGDPSASPPYSDGLLADGARWDPATNTWTALPAAPMWPGESSQMVWGGDRMYLLWNAIDFHTNFVNGFPEKATVAAYFPATDSWSVLPPNGPVRRDYAAFAWTGAELLVVGSGSPTLPTGFSYDPKTDAWTTLPEPPKPPVQTFWSGFCSGWTGDALMLWDGNANKAGLIWRPQSQTWEKFLGPLPLQPKLPLVTLPRSCIGTADGLFMWGRQELGAKAEYNGWIRRQDQPIWEFVPRPTWFGNRNETHLAWTGKYVAIWSGASYTIPNHPATPGGALYDPKAHAWLKMPDLGHPSWRMAAGAAAGPEAFFVVGGLDGDSPFGNTWFPDGGRLQLPP